MGTIPSSLTLCFSTRCNLGDDKVEVSYLSTLSSWLAESGTTNPQHTYTTKPTTHAWSNVFILRHETQRHNVIQDVT